MVVTYAEARPVGDDEVAFVVPLAGAGPAAGEFWNLARVEAAKAELGSQPVTVRRIDVAGAPWIEIASPIGPMRHLSPLELLGNNLHLPIGAFCLADGALALRQALPLDGLRVAHLDETICALAHQSAWARRSVNEGARRP
ncbi:MAG TPA: hypothetical protein VKE22_28180 [Haliangiales bacterium]|nr:hypothetical protein [Haliangiales bacterium]